MSKELSIDDWLAEYIPVEVPIIGKRTLHLEIDLAELGYTLFQATQETLQKPEATEAERITVLGRTLARLVKRWDFKDPPTADNLTRLGERALALCWDKITDCLVVDPKPDAGSPSPSPDEG